MIGILTQVDVNIAKAVQRLPESLRPYMRFWSLIGQPLGVMAMLIVVALLGFTAGNRSFALAAAVSIPALLISSILKILLHRTRPDTYQPGRWKSYSFPSGHAYGAVLSCGLLAVGALGSLPSGLAMTTVAILLVIAASTGLSRIYLGAHYPSDVIGGWLLGVGVFIIILKGTGLG